MTFLDDVKAAVAAEEARLAAEQPVEPVAEVSEAVETPAAANEQPADPTV